VWVVACYLNLINFNLISLVGLNTAILNYVRIAIDNKFLIEDIKRRFKYYLMAILFIIETMYCPIN
jgi:hypothetical protein